MRVSNPPKNCWPIAATVWTRSSAPRAHSPMLKDYSLVHRARTPTRRARSPLPRERSPLWREVWVATIRSPTRRSEIGSVGGPQNPQGQGQDTLHPNGGGTEVELRVETTKGQLNQLTVVIEGMWDDLSRDKLWLCGQDGHLN